MVIRKRKRARTSGHGKMGKQTKRLLTDLPTGILMDILSWLPLKFLFDCRCVCKTWLNIISDSHFAKLHLSRSPISILVSRERESNLLFYQTETVPSISQIDDMTFTVRFNLPNSSFKLVNSCNGLLCLSEIKKKSLYVCNPVLGEFITIEVPRADKYCRSFCFGYSVKTNEYKVLQTFLVKGCSGPKAEVYTVGTGSWRSLGNALCGIGAKGFNTFLHGAFHWVNYSTSQIVCFDFEMEAFREVPTPSQFKPEQDDCLILGVLENCLSACTYPDHGASQFEIWVMKDYGVKESWTTLFRIQNLHVPYRYPDFYNPLLMKNGRILMSHNDLSIVCYKLKTKSFCEIAIGGPFSHFFNIIAYTPCFVSLNDVAKGDVISRANRVEFTPKFVRSCFLDPPFGSCAPTK